MHKIRVGFHTRDSALFVIFVSTTKHNNDEQKYTFLQAIAEYSHFDQQGFRNICLWASHKCILHLTVF